MSDPGVEPRAPLPGEGADPLVERDEYTAAYGEPLADTLNLDSWEAGVDLADLYRRLEAEIAPAIEQERRIQDTVRRELFPLLAQAADAPPEPATTLRRLRIWRRSPARCCSLGSWRPAMALRSLTTPCWSPSLRSESA